MRIFPGLNLVGFLRTMRAIRLFVIDSLLNTMKSAAFWVFLTGFIITLGCSTSSAHKWYKLGASASDFEHDSQACEDALLATATTSMSVASSYSFDGCMEQRGWTIIDPSAH